MSVITLKVSKYVKQKGINLLEMSRKTGLSYTALYDSLLNKKRKRDLRDYEFIEICRFLDIDPKEFIEQR